MDGVRKTVEAVMDEIAQVEKQQLALADQMYTMLRQQASLSAKCRYLHKLLEDEKCEA